MKLANWICEALSSSKRTEDKDKQQERYQEREDNTGKEIKRIDPNHTIVIIGGDADLVVQCLALPSTANLFVYSPQNLANSEHTRGTFSCCTNITTLLPRFCCCLSVRCSSHLRCMKRTSLHVATFVASSTYLPFCHSNSLGMRACGKAKACTFPLCSR